MPRLGMYFIFLSIFLALHKNSLALPKQDLLAEDTNMLAVRQAGTPEMDEPDMSTEGVISSMWHRITNFFSSETTAIPPMESMMEATAPSIVKQRSAQSPGGDMTQGNKFHHDVRRMQSTREDTVFDQGGVVVASSNREVNRARRGMRYAKVLENEDSEEAPQGQKKAVRREGLVSQPVVEEFDQGDLEPLKGKESWVKIKTDSSFEWRTEKFIEESDPVENLDSENYIEEIERDPFMIEVPKFESIEVEEDDASKEPNSDDFRTSSYQKVPSIQVIES